MPDCGGSAGEASASPPGPSVPPGLWGCSSSTPGWAPPALPPQPLPVTRSSDLSRGEGGGCFSPRPHCSSGCQHRKQLRGRGGGECPCSHPGRETLRSPPAPSSSSGRNAECFWQGCSAPRLPGGTGASCGAFAQPGKMRRGSSRPPPPQHKILKLEWPPSLSRSLAHTHTHTHTLLFQQFHISY